MLLFLVTPCLVVAVQPCMVWIPIKKIYIYIYIKLGIFLMFTILHMFFEHVHRIWLKFHKHITHLRSKVNQNLNALTKVSNYISLYQRKLIMNSYIISQFNYCALVWMYDGRMLNYKMNKNVNVNKLWKSFIMVSPALNHYLRKTTPLLSQDRFTVTCSWGFQSQSLFC